MRSFNLIFLLFVPFARFMASMQKGERFMSIPSSSPKKREDWKSRKQTVASFLSCAGTQSNVDGLGTGKRKGASSDRNLISSSKLSLLCDTSLGVFSFGAHNETQHERFQLRNEKKRLKLRSTSSTEKFDWKAIGEAGDARIIRKHTFIQIPLNYQVAAKSSRSSELIVSVARQH